MAKKPKQPLFSAADDQQTEAPKRLPAATLLFQAPELTPLPPRETPDRSEADSDSDSDGDARQASSRRRRGGRGRRRSGSDEGQPSRDDDGAASDDSDSPSESAENGGRGSRSAQRGSQRQGATSKEESDDSSDGDSSETSKSSGSRGGRSRGGSQRGSRSQGVGGRQSDQADGSDQGDDSDSADEASSEQQKGSSRSSSRGRSGSRSSAAQKKSGRGGNGSGADSEDSDADSGADSNGDSNGDAKGSRSRSSSKQADDSHDQDDSNGADASDDSTDTDGERSSSRRRRRRTRTTDGGRAARAEVTSVEGSTRLEAKRQRRREGREAGRRRQSITESEYLARRESVDRVMLVREQDGLNQIAVLEDNILVEHYVARRTQTSMVGNVYLGRVQNVLPSMEAAFVDLGKGRNAVLYAGEVNWDAVGLEGEPRRIEDALKSGDQVLVQVTKDPIGHKGARLTSQITLAGRHLVLVPSGAMTGISRKLPDRERARLKKFLKEIVPEGQGVIVRTAAEGASEQQLRDDVNRLVKIWEDIQKKQKSARNVPVLLKGEPELAVRVVRDVFNEDFKSLIVSGREAHATISEYVTELAPDLADRVEHWTDTKDLFSAYRVDEQLSKGMDRKVWLPSGGSLVIERTEAMTVIDVNTGRFTGSGGSLEETVTKNNLEAAEEIVRQLRLRDIGGIIVIDFIDMVIESNRDLVLRRLIECLGRDRTRHQVAEVTSLGLVQMTRKRVGQGLVEAFSEQCDACNGRGFIVHSHPVERSGGQSQESGQGSGGQSRRGGRRGGSSSQPATSPSPAESAEAEANRAAVKATLATIAAAAAASHADSADSADEAAEAADAAELSEVDGAAGSSASESSESGASPAGSPADDAPDSSSSAGEAAADSGSTTPRSRGRRASRRQGGPTRAEDTDVDSPKSTNADPSEAADSDSDHDGVSSDSSDPSVAKDPSKKGAQKKSADEKATQGAAPADTAEQPAETDPAPETRRGRGTRRRVVATGSTTSEASAGIISVANTELVLPPKREVVHQPEKTAALLDSIVLPERDTDPAKNNSEKPKKKAPRRAVAATGSPKSAADDSVEAKDSAPEASAPSEDSSEAASENTSN